MSEWNATNQLQYVNRTVETEESGVHYPILTTRKIILQQKWVSYFYQDGIRFLDREQWRDVPTVQENDDANM